MGGGKGGEGMGKGRAGGREGDGRGCGPKPNSAGGAGWAVCFDCMVGCATHNQLQFLPSSLMAGSRYKFSHSRCGATDHCVKRCSSIRQLQALHYEVSPNMIHEASNEHWVRSGFYKAHKQSSKDSAVGRTFFSGSKFSRNGKIKSSQLLKNLTFIRSS